jgi:hypothetical protein
VLPSSRAAQQARYGTYGTCLPRRLRALILAWRVLREASQHTTKKNGDNDDDHHDGRSGGYDLLSPYHLGTTVAMHIPRRRRPIINLPAPRIPSPFQGWIARPTRRHN